MSSVTILGNRIRMLFRRWFMKFQHTDPQGAVEMHKDLQAKQSVAIHWGTFALAYEVNKQQINR